MPTDLTVPSTKEVEKAHTNADTDGKPTAIHHTLGAGPNQASPGNHTHEGGSSISLLEGFVVTDLASCIIALKALGAS
jgi:hypothetical protein